MTKDQSTAEKVAHPTIGETISFIQMAHQGQTDKGGKPYWLHPVSVMERLVNLGYAINVADLHIALLHDVVEDTEFDIPFLIDMGYSPYIIENLALLSRNVSGEGLTYMEWVRKIANSGYLAAIKIKLADNMENSDPVRIAQLPPESRDIVKRYERSIKILREALEHFI